MILTYQYRIKDSTTKKDLKEMSRSVNFVWNYCNEISQEVFRKEKKFLSGYDLSNLTSGTSQELFLHSQTIQRICEEYACRRRLSKKIRLHWRSRRRSLGWIPFKKSGVKIQGDEIRYKGRSFRFWKSRELPQGDIKEGSFSQDRCGRWYVNFQCEVSTNRTVPCEIPEDPETSRTKIDERSSQTEHSDVGIDLGLKTQITCSNKEKFSRENLTKKYEEKLGKAQRAKKKRQIPEIHQKIRNIRKDWNHKVTTKIVESFRDIFVGDVSSKKLSKTKMAKSVYDASWSKIRLFLKYKAEKLGRGMYREVKEMFSTILCSDCLQKTGPKGLRDLGVREWTCHVCGSLHERDVNAALNILRIGHDTLSETRVYNPCFIKGITVL